MGLPNPDQRWAHGCDTKKWLIDCLSDEPKEEGQIDITAIETDLLMGHLIDSPKDVDPYPVMCHPPARTSDLDMVTFLTLCKESNKGEGLTKVIKLDFKELEVIEPTLQKIAELELTTTDKGAIFLNADILPGPGQRKEEKVVIKPDAFMKACLPSIAKSDANIAFSLGYKSSCENPDGFLETDVQAMIDIIKEYELLEKKIGVVLALNARQFFISMDRFKAMLDSHPELQILCWCGKTEPALPLATYNGISTWMTQNGYGDRIGFDVRVTESSTQAWMNETKVGFVGGVQKYVLGA